MATTPIYLTVVAFPDFDGAETAFKQLPSVAVVRWVKAAVVMRKDATGKLTVKDVGLTPGKGAAGGLVLGGLVGVLTGGAGLALAGLGGLLSGHAVKRSRQAHLSPDLVREIAAALAPGSSLILAAGDAPLPESSEAQLSDLSGDVFSTTLDANTVTRLEAHQDAAHEALTSRLEQVAAGSSVPYKRIHVIVNPASGKAEPVLSTLNHVFRPYGVEWSVSITQKYGDATAFARAAVEAGYDLVAGYGGDGTQHEVANGLMGSGVVMGVLPGGTGNGFATELGLPKQLEPAVQLLCTSHSRRQIDVAQVGEEYFIQRLFTGIEPEEQTSREEKDKYGTIAYLFRDIKRMRNVQDVPYRLRVDGEETEVMGHKCYVVNSAMAGTGLSLSRSFQVDDGLLDVFILTRDLKSMTAAADRFLNLQGESASLYYWRGRQIEIEAAPSQPVWMDGEYIQRTPVNVQVRPLALTVAVA